MKVAVIDLQGFAIQTKFHPKELSIRISKKTNHYVFKEPVPFDTLHYADKRNICFTEKYHGINYNSGYVSYDEINNILIENLSDVDLVYIRGSNKKKYLFDKTLELPCLTFNIIDISTLDGSQALSCPPPKIVTTRTPMCLNHIHLPARCTQNNTADILAWLQNIMVNLQ
jgi:hypothetical protein